MSKKKRTFSSDVVTPSTLRLHRTTLAPDKHADQTDPRMAKKQSFSPELIARLTERIKKL